MNFKFLTSVALLFSQICLFGQDLNQIGKSDLFKLTGGISTNSVFNNNKEFTYYISGNVNLNISNIYNIPFSFTYSNQKFQTNNPFKFNRLSIHPSYKWVTAHIGDVSMNFSPYTLNGHQFTGVGFDVTPNDHLKIGLMYGRLLRKREYDSSIKNTSPSYKRMGYGAKVSYKLDKFLLGTTFFRAIDDKKSLTKSLPEELKITPKENLVGEIEGAIQVTESIHVKSEIAISRIKENLNSDETAASSNYFKAYNIGVWYQLMKGNIGVKYEYIDPQYRTFGGYFFNNDLENVTLNASQQLMKGRLAISISLGLQRDDLKGQRNAKMKRIVSSVNTNFRASKKINFSLGYSNFQSHSYLKNQFDDINNTDYIRKLDLSDIIQVSQNANFNSNFILKSTKQSKQNISLALSFQNAANRFEMHKEKNNNTYFYNGNIAYTLQFPKKSMNISFSTNASYNQMELENNYIFGPILSINKRFFDKKMSTNASVGYNKNIINGVNQGEIINMRLGGRFTYKKKHNFTARLLSQFRSPKRNIKNTFSATIGYSYKFGALSSKKLFKI